MEYFFPETTVTNNVLCQEEHLMSLQLIIRSSTSRSISEQKVTSCSLIRLDTILQCANKHGTLLEVVPLCLYNCISNTLFSQTVFNQQNHIKFFQLQEAAIMFYFITNAKSLPWAFKSAIIFVNHHHFHKLLHITPD